MAIAGLEHFLRKVWFFNLDGGVIDMETLAGNAVDAHQKLRSAQAAVLSDNVAAHCEYTRSERPYMQIMNGADTVHTPQLFSETDDVDVRGRSLEQNIDSIPNQNPRTPENQYRYDDTDQRIGDHITAREDRNAREDRTNGADRIHENMKESATYIQVFVVLSEQQVRACQVSEQTDNGDHQHPSRLDGRRIRESVVGLVKNIERHQNQENAV